MLLGILLMLLPIASMMLIGMYDQMMLGGWAAMIGVVLIAVWYFAVCAVVRKNEKEKEIKKIPTAGERKSGKNKKQLDINIA